MTARRDAERLRCRRELSHRADIVAVDEDLRVRRRDLEAHAAEVRLVGLYACRADCLIGCGVWRLVHGRRHGISGPYRLIRIGVRIVRIVRVVRIRRDVERIGPSHWIAGPQPEAETEVRTEGVIRTVVVKRREVPRASAPRATVEGATVEGAAVDGAPVDGATAHTGAAARHTCARREDLTAAPHSTSGRHAVHVPAHATAP